MQLYHKQGVIQREYDKDFYVLVIKLILHYMQMIQKFGEKL